LHCLTTHLIQIFWQSLKEADAAEHLGRIFMEKGDLFKIYAVYCSNQPNLASRIREFSQKYKAFAALVEVRH